MNAAAPARKWTDIDPKDAVDIDLSTDLSISAPLNEMGERCPWPWEPQLLVGAPLGQYRCGYCMAMCVAGIPHVDYTPEEQTLTRDENARLQKERDTYRAAWHSARDRARKHAHDALGLRIENAQLRAQLAGLAHSCPTTHEAGDQP